MAYIHSLVEILDDPSPSSSLPPIPPYISTIYNETVKSQNEKTVPSQKVSQNSNAQKNNELTPNTSDNSRFNSKPSAINVSEARNSKTGVKLSENTSFFIENVKIKDTPLFLEFLNKTVKCFEEFAVPKGVLGEGEEVKIWKGKVKGEKVCFWGAKENGERLEVWVKNSFDSHGKKKVEGLGLCFYIYMRPIIIFG